MPQVRAGMPIERPAEAPRSDEPLAPGQARKPTKIPLSEYDPDTPHSIEGPWGTFGVTYPTLAQEIEIGRRAAALRDNMQGLDTFTQTLCYHLATLWVVTEKPGYRPKGIDWTMLRGAAIANHYYRRYASFCDTFDAGLPEPDGDSSA